MLDTIIVRIEFTPVVEISVTRVHHFFPQETTSEGPTRINACACYNLYITSVVFPKSGQVKTEGEGELKEQEGRKLKVTHSPSTYSRQN